MDRINVETVSFAHSEVNEPVCNRLTNALACGA
jgi:hypothetical protein